jgi:hypothetical protein
MTDKIADIMKQAKIVRGMIKTDYIIVPGDPPVPSPQQSPTAQKATQNNTAGQPQSGDQSDDDDPPEEDT